MCPFPLKPVFHRADTYSVGRTASSSREAGFTIIEVLVAATVLVIGIGATLALLNAANATTSVTRGREGATNLARELTEAARGIPYARISTGSLASTLQAQPGLQNSGAPPAYTVRRRNFTYTITLSSCIMDDARDGGGDQSGGGFCSDSVAQNAAGPVGGADKNPEDYKRVTANVSWTQATQTRSVRQTAVVNNPGSAGGPAVRALSLQSFTNPPPQLTLDPSTPGYVASQKVTINFTTSSRPQTANWTLDGVAMKPAPIADATGVAWSATWDYASLDDGTYVVGAEAYDRYGVSGPGRSLNVTLNRYPPRKVLRLAGGRVTVGGSTFVELEWSANTERDIVGYRVYRRPSSGAPIEVCALQSATTCRDSSAPATGDLTYYAVAYDNGPAGALRAGTASDDLTVVESNTPPSAVINLTATANGNGTTTLKWTRPPSPADPDPGDGIDFYRVYRDGLSVDDRVARWYDGNGSVVWIDTLPAGLVHTYYVTAVDQHFAESAPVEATG
jgi:Tfp pilus assembly protein PilV